MRRSAVNAARDWTPHKDVRALTAKLLKWPDAVALKPPKPRCGRADILQPLPHGACQTRWQVRNRRWPFSLLYCDCECLYMGPCPPPATCFLALSRYRTRGGEIDKFREDFGGGWRLRWPGGQSSTRRRELCNFRIRSGFSLDKRLCLRTLSRLGSTYES